MSRITWRGVAIVAFIVIVGVGVAVGLAFTIQKATGDFGTDAADASFEASRSSVNAEESASRSQVVASRAATISADSRYFAELDQMSVPYAQNKKDLVVENGHLYCNEFNLGQSYAEVLSKDNDPYAIQKINAAVDVYCPQFKDRVK